MMKFYSFSIFLSFLIFFFSLQPLSSTEIPAEEFYDYLHYSEISPAQIRYSSRNVKDKVEKAIQKKSAVHNPEIGEWTLKFFNGKSILSPKEALPVVKSSFGYVLADGHHDVLSSLALKAYWIPVKIIADLSELSSNQFWEEAERKGWAYLVDLNGIKQACPPSSFEQLVDDPNRYFAAISARKYSSDLTSSIGAEYPLWIKVGKDIPFIEFMIADVLFRAGLVYDDQLGENPPEEFVELARQELLKANLSGLRVVTTRMHYTQIDL